MKRKVIKRIVVAGILLTGLASSISIKKLDKVRAEAEAGKFDPVAYAQDFWDNELMPNLGGATLLSHLIPLLDQNPEKAFNEYSKALGIGNIRFFMVQGKGEIREIDENEITVMVQTEEGFHPVRIATEYIFGNAVRDASGRVDMADFEQTMDFNNVSAEINQLIRKEVLPGLKQNSQVGDKITFYGAIEMNKEQVNLSDLEIIPVKVGFEESKKLVENAGS
ncbi:DUF2291 domain-containing protein [Echinicola jeungdonensis]|uniref:DUF2291 domain-containing protein n=1 Tax=Echinicola jeungdonensis TaxID=709343 RepID=A0ABV5J3V9_9BACT|nr:DUF2291 domain-containing protein [Echinicola jeungdonensis]MDN3669334.1 DUF2291 domain-containing protein [Echinicola jeungdonensis]